MTPDTDHLPYWEVAVGERLRLQGYLPTALYCSSILEPVYVWKPEIRTALGWNVCAATKWYALLRSKSHYHLYTVTVEGHLIRLGFLVESWESSEDPGLYEVKEALRKHASTVIPINRKVETNADPTFQFPARSYSSDTFTGEEWGDDEYAEYYGYTNYPFPKIPKAVPPRCPVAAP